MKLIKTDLITLSIIFSLSIISILPLIFLHVYGQHSINTTIGTLTRSIGYHLLLNANNNELHSNVTDVLRNMTTRTIPLLDIRHQSFDIPPNTISDSFKVECDSSPERSVYYFTMGGGYDVYRQVEDIHAIKSIPFQNGDHMGWEFQFYNSNTTFPGKVEVYTDCLPLWD